MQKVIIIGCPGSGKSTFSRALNKITHLPLYHLDMLYWNSDKTTVSRDIFDARLNNVMRGEKWIIDGNYARTMERRIDACDTVFFLDFPTEVCLDGIEKRKGKPRSDMPFEDIGEDPEFIEMIKNFNSQNRPEIIKLFEKYSSKNIVVFNSRKESEKYLSALKVKGE